MTKHEYECERLILAEMQDGIEANGLFATHHDGMGVIEEEVEEALNSMTDCESAFDGLRSAVFHDSNQEALSYAEDVYVYGRSLMIEAMQVAAMAEKYIRTFGEGVKNGKSDDS